MDKCLDKSSVEKLIKGLTFLFFFLLSCNLCANQASIARCLDYAYFKQITIVLEKEWSKENIFKDEKEENMPLVRLKFTLEKNKGLLLDSIDTFFSNNAEAEKLAKNALISSKENFPQLPVQGSKKVNLMANFGGNGKVELLFIASDKDINYQPVVDRITKEIKAAWKNKEVEIATNEDPYFIMVFKVCSSGEVVDGSFSLEYPDAAFRSANFKGIEESAEEALLKAKERFFPLPIGAPGFVTVKIKVAVRKVRDISTSKKY